MSTSAERELAALFHGVASLLEEAKREKRDYDSPISYLADRLQMLDRFCRDGQLPRDWSRAQNETDSPWQSDVEEGRTRLDAAIATPSYTW